MSPEEPEQLAALGHEDGDGDGHQHPALDEDARVRLPVGALGSVRSGIRTRHLSVMIRPLRPILFLKDATTLLDLFILFFRHLK